ncbi:MAG: IS21 family transposase [Pseudomonadota bacterium]
MPAKRVSMNKIKEVIRLKAAGISLRPIAQSVRLSLGAVSKYAKAAADAGLTWPLPAQLTDEALTRLILGAPADAGVAPKFVPPDYAAIHQALKQKGVTLQLLWHEYRECHGEFAYRYSQFCTLYREWAARLKRSMRQTHRAGEKLFVDYCGQTMPIYDRLTGEIWPAQIFVAVLGASNYTYAEASRSQQLPDWLGAHARAFEFMGGCPAVVVPDNLKSGVNKACRYEPEINKSYSELAAHYGVAVIPARPFKPQDKAKAEVGVQIVERWILAALRHRKFFSLDELNQAIRELLNRLNAKPFKKLPGSRISAFESLDKPALKPLPAHRYEYAQWKKARVSIDYHLEFEGHFYSVPHRLVGKEVELRITANIVECLYKNQRVASHARSHRRGAHTTVAEHMPKAHRAHMQWTPGKLLNWAITIGPATRDIVQHQLTQKPHPEMGYRACLGLLSLARKFGNDRLEAACKRAIVIHSPTRKSVVSILKAGLDQVPANNQTSTTEPLLPPHSNVRGAKYYH